MALFRQDLPVQSMLAGIALLFTAAGLLHGDQVAGTGSSGAGQVGNGLFWFNTPVQISAVERIAVSGSHALGLKSDNTVWAWGANGSGQLGDGTTNPAVIPVLVAGLTDVVSVAAGKTHSLAATSEGLVYAWGRNDQGQLCNGTQDGFPFPAHPIPSQIAGLDNVVHVVAEDDKGFAIKGDGTLWSWSGIAPPAQTGPSNVATLMEDRHHQIVLHTDDTVSASGVLAPVMGTVPGLPAISVVAAGSLHGLALTAMGEVWSWGGNQFGQLGDGTQVDNNTPTQVTGLANIVSIAASQYHSFAVRNDGTVWTWGLVAPGFLGDETPQILTSPTQITSLLNVASIATQGFRHLAILNDNSVVEFSADASMPTPQSGLTAAMALEAGAFHNLVIQDDSTVWGWGANWHYELGDPVAFWSGTPLQVPGISNALAVAAGGSHSLALTDTGDVWSWGSNRFGQAGHNSLEEVQIPEPLGCFPDFLAVAAGENHSLAITSKGTVYAWGLNDMGQLGDGTREDRSEPVEIPGLTGAVSVHAGWAHSLVLRENGTAWTWGANLSGQLGNHKHGFLQRKTSPVQANIVGVVAVTAGAHHNLAIREDGSLWGWGDNLAGQLGLGESGDGSFRDAPTPIPGMTDIVAFSAGDWHSVAAKSDGTVWAWGRNDSGQLGTGTRIDSDVPQQIPGASNIVQVSAGAWHTLLGDNQMPPSVLGTWPADGSAETAGDYVAVTFTEPVANVSVDDLSLSEGAADLVAGYGSGPYLFRLTMPPLDLFGAMIDGNITDWNLNPLVSHAWDYRFTVDSDLNRDGDVDTDDFLTFSVCFNGALHAPSAICPDPCSADLDGDADVDGTDFLTFSNCFNGSLNPPNCL